MPYVEDYLEEEMIEEDDDFYEEVLEMLEEDDDWEEEWDDEEALAEAPYIKPRYPRYNRKKSSSIGRTLPNVGRARGSTAFRVGTSAGTAQARFPKPMATQASVNRVVKNLKKNISKINADLRKIDKTLDKNTATLDKKVNRVNANLEKIQEQVQQTTLLPMLLTKPADLDTITFDAAPTANTPATVTSQKYKAQDTMTTLFLPLMMMSDGLRETRDSNMMMVLALMLSQT